MKRKPELDYTPIPQALRAAFRDAVTEFNQWRRGQPEPRVSVGRGSIAISQIFIALRFSGELVPRDLVGEVWERDGVPRAKHYAAATRHLLRSLP
jgi:hypothetical protein